MVHYAIFGLDDMVADFYWIAGVNYFGADANQQLCFGQLSNYMDLVVSLAPEFESAYRFAGVAIPCNNGKDWFFIEEANRFLKTGIKHFPNNWVMRVELAFHLSNFDQDYLGAAEQLTAAAKLPGSPRYVGLLATRMLGTQGDLDAAENVTEELIKEVPDDSVRDALRQRQNEIRTLKAIKLLNDARVKFEDQRHAHITRVEDLVPEFITALPLESLGGEFVYDEKTNEIGSTKLKDRLKVFVRPE